MDSKMKSILRFLPFVFAMFFMVHSVIEIAQTQGENKLGAWLLTINICGLMFLVSLLSVIYFGSLTR